MTRLYRLIILNLLLLLSACSALQQQNLKGPGWYRVKPTDTLYSVAWRYGLDPQQLALWNGILESSAIIPGQQLILIKPDKLPTKPEPVTTSGSKSLKKKPVIVKPLAPSYNQAILWRWPVEGTVLNRFSINDLGRRGIDIAGKIGQPVNAVAAGKVVYSGSGVSGLGNLIIIKHDNTYLSAYAFNSKIIVQEGSQVKRGAHIADMGRGKNNKPMLRFQIRKNGKPVDPLHFLPEMK
ncbi:MAG: peptidoglycan DD-metalloendopeptidase family protein [Gammaproteobacteria bacterium]|nr:peptidoglycan DD-metalloendopeptidase family protein [Gammaproteobacteria bacterium]